MHKITDLLLLWSVNDDDKLAVTVMSCSDVGDEQPRHVVGDLPVSRACDCCGGERRRRRIRAAAVLGRTRESDERDAGTTSDAAERPNQVVTGGQVAGWMADVHEPRGTEV